MTLAWSAALIAQAALAMRLPPGALRQFHAWQALGGLALLAISYLGDREINRWSLAAWRIINAAMLVRACAGRWRADLSIVAGLTLLAVAGGSAAHFERDLIQVYSIRWLLLVIPLAYWIGAAWPDRWMLAYAVLCYAFALIAAWNWYGSAALQPVQQWAQAVLFVACVYWPDRSESN